MDLHAVQQPLKERYRSSDLLLDAPEAGEEDLERLMERTDRYCTVLQTLRRPPAIEATRAEAQGG